VPIASPGAAAAIHGRITVDPSVVAVDEAASIRLSGFAPSSDVTVRATTVGTAYPDTAGSGAVRESSAVFRTDAHGAVDLTSQAPVSGSYVIANPMGLFWSMQELPSRDVTTTVPAPAASTNPAVFLAFRHQLTAEVEGNVVATATLDQTLGSPDLVERDIAEDGILGQFYLPPGKGPFPAVIVLSGSNGGLAMRKPKLLAEHGFATLSLAYFRYSSPLDGSSLPQDMDRIPLEYFQKAITWLQNQPGVDPGRIAIHGGSVGGMVALHVAAVDPRVKAVVAISPPTVTWDGLEDQPSLTFHGNPLPFVTPFGPERLARPFNDAVAAGTDFASTVPPILAAIQADPDMAAAMVPVERIKGSILIISGTNDTQLPGVVYGELAIDRLKAHGFTFPYRHMINVGAGHIIEFPYIDRSTEIREGGGTPETMELAGEATWPVILENLAAMR
jgi:dienelactone hydrolase